MLFDKSNSRQAPQRPMQQPIQQPKTHRDATPAEAEEDAFLNIPMFSREKENEVPVPPTPPMPPVVNKSPMKPTGVEFESPVISAGADVQDVVPAQNSFLFSAGNTMKGGLDSSTDIIIEGIFTGPIHTAANIFIRGEGRVNGDISAKLVKVTDGGTLKGNADAETVIVDGRMHGNIDARSTQFRASARYKGNVVTDTLSTNPGASIHGNISINGDDDDDLDDFDEVDTSASASSDEKKDNVEKPEADTARDAKQPSVAEKKPSDGNASQGNKFPVHDGKKPFAGPNKPAVGPISD